MRQGCFRSILSTALLACLLQALGLAQTASKPGAAHKPDPRAETVIFVVTRTDEKAYVDPIVIISRGKLLAPASTTSREFARFTSRYYRAGRKYRLLFGGAENGSVILKERSGTECLGAQCGAELETGARINGLVMGVATDSPALGFKSASRRAPTQAERAAVASLGRSYFRAKGLAAPAIEKMETINMTAMDLNRDGRAEIAASFLAETDGRGKALHHIFLIAEPAKASFKQALARYTRTAQKDLPGGGSLDDVKKYVLSEVLADHIDMDRDGYAEVISAAKGYEGVRYRIYRRVRGEWRVGFEVYNYRCAY
jgi:hypothetical protein